jgi:hypothetical protein
MLHGQASLRLWDMHHVPTVRYLREQAEAMRDVPHEVV